MNGQPDSAASTGPALRPAAGLSLKRSVRLTGRFALIALAAGLTAGIIAPTGLQVPAGEPGLTTLTEILRTNLTLLAVIGACAALQRFARHEHPPWIRRITDLVIATFIAVNIAALGFTVGQLGLPALIRILPHAWLEIPAFSLGIYGYLNARRSPPKPRRMIVLYGSATLMLLAAAPLETYVSGAIR